MSATKKAQKVLVIEDFSLRGPETPICCLENLSKWVCCLLGPAIAMPPKLPSLVKSRDYHPLLLLCIGSNEAVMRRLQNIERDFVSLREKLKGLGAQTVFSIWRWMMSPIWRVGHKRKEMHGSDEWLEWLVLQSCFGVLWSWMNLWESGDVGSASVHLTKGCKNILGSKLAGHTPELFN